MSYGWLAYGIVLTTWAVFEYRDLRRSGFPQWLVMVDVYSIGVLCAVTFMHSFGRVVVMFVPVVVAVLAASAALRIIAFRHEEWEIHLSPLWNKVSESVALVVVLILLGPAIHLLVSSTKIALWPVAAVALASGAVVGTVAPRLRSCKRWEAERQLAEWAASPLEYGQLPEETELLDRRELCWPGEEDPVWVALVRFRIDSEWHTGVVGPYVFAFGDQKRIAGKSIDDVYAEYAAHYGSEVLRLNVEPVTAV